MKIRVFYSVSLIGLLVGAAFSGLFTNIVRAADDAIAIIDEELLDLINQYADDYYKPEWNVTLDQYKAWIATIAWSEGNRGGYVAHSQWNPGSDVFYHKIVGGKFRFSTGIGPFQLDFHGGNWPTIKKLNITKALLDVLIWHYNKFGKDDNLSKFSKESDWNGVKPGRIETRWREVTGTEWRDHKDGKNINLKWTEVVNRIAIKEDPRYSYKDNIKYMGKVKWNIDKSEGIKTDGGKKVILDGYFPTWLVNARDDTGTKLFDYYYTYNRPFA
ncbi:MAG TPA: hypothetical protein ENI51_02510 [Candidatus Atribacteria bacterium]|nr:hypothetical protein [Candidatus Atribacteria bacterium]